MRVRVMVELRPDQAPAAGRLRDGGFVLDEDFPAIDVTGPEDTGTTSRAARGAKPGAVLVRGEVDEADIDALAARPGVLRVWRDTPTATFDRRRLLPLAKKEELGPCPLAPCDCDTERARGTLDDVAEYLGADRIWAAGHTGTGIVVGIVDTGITARGRIEPDDVNGRLVRNVVDGWPAGDWGRWADDPLHGNMTATGVLGMAPDVSLYDIRGVTGSISDAIAGFDWAIRRHRRDGTPHILSNSWGVYEKSWDRVYATDPNHPFTRKVEEALDEGILVVFAAGNCGIRCPSERCGDDTGPGKSIWGANGHPRVMTVGAVNINEHWIGYSSQGPAAFADQKPDFCAVSHYEGYFEVDTGTSAAAPVAAGVVALLKQALPSLDQVLAMQVLKDTAKELGQPRWNPQAGAGIIQAHAAFEALPPPEPPEPPDFSWIAPVVHQSMNP